MNSIKKIICSVVFVLAMFFCINVYADDTFTDDIVISDLYATTASKGMEYAYTEMGFNFKRSGDSKEYEAYITGIAVIVKEKQGTPETVEEKLTLLAKDIAASFYNGENFEFVDNGDNDNNPMIARYGLHIIPIDAEKLTTNDSDMGDTSDPNYPLYDVNLCWAASVSNMLEYTGWAKEAGFNNADSVLDYYMENFFDATGLQPSALRWFFNGINTEQQVDKNGNFLYQYSNNTLANNRNAGTGACLTNYSADSLFQYHDLAKKVSDSAIDDMTKYLSEDKSAVAVNVYYIEKVGEESKQQGGHALTLFGYIKQTNSTDFYKTRAIFVANSDNSSQNNVSKARDNAIDKLTMYRVGSCEYIYPELVGFVNVKDRNITTVIANYVVLNKLDTTKEEVTGTKKSTEDPDFVITNLFLQNSEEVTVMYPALNDTLTIFVKVSNYGASLVDKYPDGVRIDFEVESTDANGNKHVYKDYGYLRPKDGDNSALFPLQYRVYETEEKCVPDTLNEVYFSAKITKVTSLKDSTEVPEVYVTNNTLSVPLEIYVNTPGGRGGGDGIDFIVDPTNMNMIKTAEQKDVPLTADSNDLFMYIIFAVAAALAIVRLLVNKRKIN